MASERGTPRDRFGAYLRRHELCTGPAVTGWDAAGTSLLVVDGGRRWRIPLDPEAGADAPLERLADDEPVAVGTWTRGWYQMDMEVPEVGSPDGRWFASVRGGNIHVRPADAGADRQVTSDGTADTGWDIESLRGRLLPGLLAETAFTSPWSPDATRLAAFRRDITGVFRLPTVDWLGRFETTTSVPFQKTDARIDRFHPHVVDVETGRALPIDVGPVEDRYVQLLGWRPDGHELFLVSYSRDLSEARIFAADAGTGAARLVLAETCPTFLRLQHDTLMSNVHGFCPLPDSSGFLWLSQRSGWNHVYRYDNQGRLVRALTEGAWPVHDIRHLTATHAFFTAAPDLARPYDVHVCRVPLAGGPVERLTEAPGIHQPRFHPSGAFVDTHSSVDRPPATELRAADGRLLRPLFAHDIGPLRAVGYAPPEEFTVTAADGVTQLWGVMYKPADFDPARSYPLVEHIYGGPQVAVAARHFSLFEQPARNLAWALAQLGCVVVCVDARGTPGRSKAFQDVVHGAWGVHEMADHAAAVRQLIDRHPWLDGARVGIIGHSWGAYFATAALIQQPDLYRVAVASSPGFVPRASILYEPYLGLPARNPAAYDHADLTRHAAGLRGRLLLTAGSLEAPVLSDAMKMSRALIEAGVQHEFAVLPGEYHAYRGAGEAYFVQKAAGFLQQHLAFGDGAPGGRAHP